MERFQPFPQCVDCLMGLAHTASTLATRTDSHLHGQAEAAARKILSEAEKKGLSSPETASLILREISRLSGVSDPYTQFKAQELALAKKVCSRLESCVGADLRSRTVLAALGNSLDFFKAPEEALAEIPDQFQEGFSFFHDDVDRLETFLSNNPELILYLADNAGEIYFDLPLYEYIRERAGRTVLAVKGGPSMDDLTRAELKVAKLEEKFDEVVDTGTDGVGIDWNRVSREFLELFEAADLVLVKGMANFENVYPRDPSPPVFLLLKLKCQPFQGYLKAPPGSYLALWRDGIQREVRANPGILK